MHTLSQPITRVALCLRVSPTHGPDSETQLLELREYAAFRVWSIVGEYVDHCSSGPKVSRPSLIRLMRDARGGTFDAVLVWKLDRFGRSLRHLIQAMTELTALGISFASLHDGLEICADDPLDARREGG